jgi:hypothetical protein
MSVITLAAGMTALAAESVAPNLQQDAIGAYLYAYPLVTMEITRRVSTNVAAPDGNRAPMNQFAHARKFLDDSFHDVTTPNADTLYSAAWLDVSKEPVILSVPEAKGRYFLLPMLDAWTNVFFSPGSRTTGDKAQAYAIVGPNWFGKIPAGIREVRAPTNLVWIIGRTYCTGTDEDYAAVHDFQDGLKLVPLSAYGHGEYTPPGGEVDPGIDMTLAPRAQVSAFTAPYYFTLFAELLKQQRPALADAQVLQKLANLGIGNGQSLRFEQLRMEEQQALLAAPKAALAKIAADLAALKRVNGWALQLDLGTYGTNYPLRAAVAYAGLGANLAADAVYPMSLMDTDGKPYDGARKYVLHFKKGELPPVNAFWSLSMYDENMFFVANPLHRYNIGSRDKLVKNADGSADLFIQHESPGPDREGSWLPAPEGRFNLVLHLYWPKAEVLNGRWVPPAVKQQ